MSSIFGVRFQVATFGESHGKAVGAVVDGCPPKIPLTEADIQKQLDRRRPGQSRLTTQRREQDKVVLLSGVDQGMTLGTPIALTIPNTDAHPSDYDSFRNIPRPSHADFTYRIKYGITPASGGGRASARETAARVAAGVIAEQFVQTRFGIQIVAWVSSVGSIDAPDLTSQPLTREYVDASKVRCPDPTTAKAMMKLIDKVKQDDDSTGGLVTCVCRNVPAGWGEPVFGKMESLLAAAMLSIPAAKGFEVGSGFAGSRMRGSEHNDPFVMKNGRLGTTTNRSGGIQGGITNGEPIVFRVAFKPTASIARNQNTADYDGNPVVLQAKGRHDPCVVPRAVPVVEAMAAIVLADTALLNLYPGPNDAANAR